MGQQLLLAAVLGLGLGGCANVVESDGSAKPSGDKGVSRTLEEKNSVVPIDKNSVADSAQDRNEGPKVTAESPSEFEWLKYAVINHGLVIAATIAETVEDGTAGNPPQVAVQIDSVVSGSMNLSAADIVWRPGDPEMRCGNDTQEQKDRAANRPIPAPKAGTYFLWFDRQRVRQYALQSTATIAAVAAGQARSEQLRTTTFFVVSGTGRDLFQWPKAAPSVRKLQGLHSGKTQAAPSGVYDKLPEELVSAIQGSPLGAPVIDAGRIYRVHAGCGAGSPATCRPGTFSSVFAKDLDHAELPSTAVAPTDGDGAPLTHDEYDKHRSFYEQFRNKHPAIVSNGKIYSYGMLLGAKY